MEKKISMKVVNPNAAGIDIGSKSHYVAVGQGMEDVKEFGVYSEDHKKMIRFLNEKEITTIAMESTGSYWQTLFSALQSAGFEVLLVNGNQIKNVKGKTDVKDCMWIQKLHSLGLLKGSFLPSQHVEMIRTYHRHRQSLNEECSVMINKMQKTLRLMNVRLDIVINDIMGKSGRAIIGAILEGERDGGELASLAHSNVKKSKLEIAKALQGQWQPELLYQLRDCYELHEIFRKKIQACDNEIEKLLSMHLEQNSKAVDKNIKLRIKSSQKNQPKINLSSLSYRYFGVDLFAIEGVSSSTILTFIAEVGTDIQKFNTAKQFVSWLRLAPNNKISGGKIIRSKTPKGKNNFAITLRNAANTIAQRKDGALVSFFKRIAYKKGRAAAITATARKLAVIIWNMVIFRQPFNPIEEQIYNEKVRKQIISNIKKKMNRLGLSINDLSPNPGIS